MESSLVPVVSGITAVIAAIITSFCMTKSAKKRRSFDSILKISEFRQKWINDLRNTMAEFQSYAIMPNEDPTEKREFYKLGTKIELLMNRDDEDYKSLHDVLEEFFEKASATRDEKFEVDEKYVEICQRILKREWKRLKDGLEEKKNLNDVKSSSRTLGKFFTEI